MKLLKSFFTSLFLLSLSYSTLAVTEEQASIGSSVHGDFQAIDNIGVANLTPHAGQVYSAGQPSIEQFEALAHEGIKHVINLRGQSEQDWDEKALVNSLNMNYVALPITGAKDINVENARLLTQLLMQKQGEAVLVHCASSNRVGALMAIAAYESGQNLEASIDEGKSWGLKSLEPVVRNVISNQH
ncbi:fused DSP-PTPase phosphatase/NAD kinase-like protein [Pseudoalteromonas sp. ZZD1]|uniref:fused DSP-PTPase phosphatase/NAD kinase-like protein n=1 Tax=Pseudoalteromonas sp. ZZD1 TaxID=3139395 RepID=UPI003BA8F548